MDNENKELNEMVKRGMEDLGKNDEEIDEKLENFVENGEKSDEPVDRDKNKSVDTNDVDLNNNIEEANKFALFLH